MQAEQNQDQSPPILEDLNQLRIAIPFNCVRCSYDLLGLSGDTDCPECGQPVRVSIYETIDPATKRLAQLPKPKVIGNMLPLIVISFFISALWASVGAAVVSSHFASFGTLHLRLRDTECFTLALAFAFLTVCFSIPILKVNRNEHFEGCNRGLLLIGVGSICWTVSMLLAMLFVRKEIHSQDLEIVLYDTIFPAVSGVILFIGFKLFIPRIGIRSRAFRQAQVSRQRMNDLLIAVVVICFGRILMAMNQVDSNTYTFGSIIMIMGMSLILVGLGYTVWNTLWIRKSLISPPPSIQELVRPID
ncbi:MAG: hypothetical protein CMJ38_05405 [Phycisphaerae bacterium]|nr:hypothetical protein [Phycisphaerae bacterium]